MANRENNWAIRNFSSNIPEIFPRSDQLTGQEMLDDIEYINDYRINQRTKQLVLRNYYYKIQNIHQIDIFHRCVRILMPDYLQYILDLHKQVATEKLEPER